MAEFNVNRARAVHSHVDSFNAFIDHYSKHMVKRIPPVYLSADADHLKHFLNPFDKPHYVQVSVLSLRVDYPTRPGSECLGSDTRMFPRHAKIAHTTYEAPLIVKFGLKVPGVPSVLTKEINVGHIPVMVKSKRCNLDGLSPSEMTQQGEDLDETGGYFVIRGNERIVRQLIVLRSNYPLAIKSENNRSKHVLFTDYSIMMRTQWCVCAGFASETCSCDDGCSVSNILYLTVNKRCVFRTIVKSSVVLIPFGLLLRATMPAMSDDELKQRLLQDAAGDEELTVYYHRFFLDMTEREPLLSDVDFEENRYLYRLGSACWSQIQQYVRPGATHEECGAYLLKHYVLLQAKTNAEKFETLLYMFKKLVKVSRGEIQTENYDSFAFQELLLPGQIYSCILKESLYSALLKIRNIYQAEIMELCKSINGDEARRSKRRVVEVDLGAHDPKALIESLLERPELFSYAIDKVAPDIPKKLHYFLATGNATNTHFELTQSSGLTVVAERINYHRFMSHFRSLHRGSIFAKMRSTEVRKLLGETWGFICPVHTPDGAPCGLLLHLTQFAVPVTDADCGGATDAVKAFLRHQGYCVDFTGTEAVAQFCALGGGAGRRIPVLVDGIPVCSVPVEDARALYDETKNAKRHEKFGLKQHYELVALPDSKGQYTCLMVLTYPGRVIRPVRCVKNGSIEWIGPISQLWSTIAVSEEEMQLSHDALKEAAARRSAEPLSVEAALAKYGPGAAHALKEKPTLDNVPVKYEYVEVTPTAILSVTAALTPFSNHNQSPRNMYQCQMLKQSMGVPYHCEQFRSDVKAYRLLFPQKPLVTTEEFRKMKYDDYPTGMNAVVAVIAHTGFDMEDAMIINKSSLERGAFHGCIYKTKVIDAVPPNAKAREGQHYFSNTNHLGSKVVRSLDRDGLPSVGLRVRNGTVICRIESRERVGGEHHVTDRVEKYHDEDAVVDQVTLIGFNDANASEKVGTSALRGNRATIKFRIVRNPIVGDKFASRHGQKGILSMAWPAEDMPFLESGITPDIIFNPHGLPSRMTIGKLIECMAGKSAAVHGEFQDATCFRKYPRQVRTGNKWIDHGGLKGWEERGGRYMTPEEDAAATEDDVVDYFGKTLLQAGYNYYGTESMYCGTLGTEIKTHIFVGCIFYQRLRHMVSDKAQVRATGPVDAITKQPVKGRKNRGGIRFGEMERDSLIAHGASALLQDRLMHCSDAHTAYVCPKCGSILSATITSVTLTSKFQVSTCRLCNVKCKLVTIPYVLRCVPLSICSTPFAEYLGSGYDVVKANTLGDVDHGEDLGHRAPIIDFYWAQSDAGVTNSLDWLQPLGGWVRPITACGETETVTEGADSSNNEDVLQVDVGVGAALKDGVGGSANIGYNGHSKLNVKTSSKVHKSAYYCFTYAAGMPPYLKWDTTDDFKAELEYLPTDVSLLDTCTVKLFKKKAKACEAMSQWVDFFTLYGTHVTTEVHLGGKITRFLVAPTEALDTFTKAGFDAKVAVSAIISGALANIKGELSHQEQEAIQKLSDSCDLRFSVLGGIHVSKHITPQSLLKWRATVPIFPMPIRMTVTSLDTFLGAAYRQAYLRAMNFYVELGGALPWEVQKHNGMNFSVKSMINSAFPQVVHGRGTDPVTLDCPNHTRVLFGFVLEKDDGKRTFTVHLCPSNSPNCVHDSRPKAATALWALCGNSLGLNIVQHARAFGASAKDKVVRCRSGYSILTGFILQTSSDSDAYIKSLTPCQTGSDQCSTDAPVAAHIWAVCVDKRFPGLELSTTLAETTNGPGNAHLGDTLNILTGLFLYAALSPLQAIARVMGRTRRLTAASATPRAAEW
ncbi:DNA-directed RNA polymerase I RPA2 [Babesia caballi]|uniref:DNA-directed RNA polymerase subunit beta n=1 Tax=Babesia caballi TaxID=5871 RepID=A0AAV4LWS9_BABCB|nr:DNA-directed RNA polymerase I RPA2 [Babesia caballi]